MANRRGNRGSITASKRRSSTCEMTWRPRCQETSRGRISQHSGWRLRGSGSRDGRRKASLSHDEIRQKSIKFNSLKRKICGGGSTLVETESLRV